MSPAIILVPGMSCVGSFVYAPLMEELKKAGLEHVEAVDLPSVDCVTTKAHLKPNALEADVKHIRSAIERALSNSLDVVVVGHSYGGTPSLYACEGLWKTAQPAGAPGVLRAALLTSSLTLPGGSIAGDRMEYGKKHGGIDDSGGNVQMVGEVSSQILLSERTPDG
jgi:alpha-beta hydrolase superfamily lysophospholipase